MSAPAIATPEPTITEPGIYMDLPGEVYARIDAVNYSRLKHFARTPAHAREHILHPPKPTDAMELGTAIHMAILEPARFAAEYVRAPKCDRRTTIGKAQWSEFEDAHKGRNYLSGDEWEQCEGMAEAVSKHQLANDLLYGEGRNEVSVIWNDQGTGMLCRARLDRFKRYLGCSYVIDIKSTADASPAAFQRQVARLGYHIQTAFYLDGLETLAPGKRRFLNIAIETTAPFGIIVYEMDPDTLAEGRACYRRYLAEWAECKRTNIWPSYPGGIYPLSLPRWALSATTSEEE